MSAVWVPNETRDAIVDFIRHWAQKTDIGVLMLVYWLKLAPRKFYDWRKRYGKINQHNGWIPRDTWLEGWESEAILRFYSENAAEGYRRVTFMMLDDDQVREHSHHQESTSEGFERPPLKGPREVPRGNGPQ